MDVRMPRCDGVEATRLVRDLPDAPAVVVLTAFDTDQFVVGALRAGAAGFLLKHAAAPAVDAVRQGRGRHDELHAGSAPAPVDAAPAAPSPAAGRVASLSEREAEIAALVAEGLTNAEIGERALPRPADREDPPGADLREARRDQPRPGRPAGARGAPRAFLVDILHTLWCGERHTAGRIEARHVGRISRSPTSAACAQLVGVLAAEAPSAFSSTGRVSRPRSVSA